MRADDGGHVDHEDVARQFAAGLVHETREKRAGARFGPGVQDGESFQRQSRFQEGCHARVGLTRCPHRANRFELTVGDFDQRFDIQHPAEECDGGGDASTAAQVVHRVERGGDAQSAAGIRDCGEGGREACTERSRSVRAGFGGFGRGQRLESDSQRERAAVHDRDLVRKTVCGLSGDTANRGQLRGGVDRENVVTARDEQFLVARRKIADGGRGGGREDFHGGQGRVKIIATDALAVRELLSFNNEDGGDDLDAEALDQVGGQVAGRVGDEAKFHIVSNSCS